MSGMQMQRYWAGILAAGILGAGLAGAQAQTPTPASEQASAPTTSTYQPKFPGDPARSDSEAQALGYMRVVLRAQRNIRSAMISMLTSLEALAGTGSFTKRMAQVRIAGITRRVFGPHEDGFIFT